MISIVFGRTDLPVGCIVTPYRRTASGGISITAPIRIPLVRSLKEALGIASEDAEMRTILRAAGRRDIRPFGAQSKARLKSGKRRDAPGLLASGGFSGSSHYLRRYGKTEGVGHKGVFHMRPSSPFSTIRFEHEGMGGQTYYLPPDVFPRLEKKCPAYLIGTRGDG